MGFKGEEYEPVPSEMDPTRRFYNDLFHKSNSYIDLAISAESLLHKTAGYSAEESLDRLYGAGIPTAYDYEQNPTEAYDQFLVMPIKLIAPHLDDVMRLDTLNDWYAQTVKYIMKYTKGRHAQDCLDEPLAAQSNACNINEECPLIFAAKHLKNDVINPDFTEFEYIVDSERQYELAIMKMRIAQRFNLEYEYYGNVLIDQYQKKYSVWFGGLPDE
jgi:hypothetical protein